MACILYVILDREDLKLNLGSKLNRSIDFIIVLELTQRSPYIKKNVLF